MPAEGASETVITAALLIQERSVDEIAAKLLLRTCSPITRRMQDC